MYLMMSQHMEGKREKGEKGGREGGSEGRRTFLVTRGLNYMHFWMYAFAGKKGRLSQ